MDRTRRRRSRKHPRLHRERLREYADALIERLILSVNRLESFPESGRRVPESTDPKVRELLVESYRVIYRLKKGSVQILAVAHGARNLAGMKPKPWAKR